MEKTNKKNQGSLNSQVDDKKKLQSSKSQNEKLGSVKEGSFDSSKKLNEKTASKASHVTKGVSDKNLSNSSSAGKNLSGKSYDIDLDNDLNDY
jgi:hypothetical protein